MAGTVLLILLNLCFLHALMATTVFGLEPSFDVPVINVTVQEGDTAVLPCSVDHLKDHKVVWTDQWSTLLTLDDRRIIDDTRISIERPYTRDWNLHIRKATYNDRGQYTCQINTNPVKTKTVMLVVLVPSKIINELSSTDTTQKEGDKVTLVCNVTGVPMPQVTWYKLPTDGAQAKERLDLETGVYTLLNSCTYSLKPAGIGTAGELLIIHNVSRYCDGTYECVAYNEVGPAVTRQIKVFVEFPPEILLPNRRIGQYLNKETILDCEVIAYPHGVMSWMKDGRDLNFLDKQKYQLEFYSGNEDSKKKTLSLRVKNIENSDFGQYTCFAKNYLGQDEESMVLYNYEMHISKTSTTTTPIPIPNRGVVDGVQPFGNEDPLDGGGRTYFGQNETPGENENVVVGGNPGRFPGTSNSNNAYPGEGSRALGSNLNSSTPLSTASTCCLTALAVLYYLAVRLTL